MRGSKPHALDLASAFTLAVPTVLSSIRPFIEQGTTRSDRIGNTVFVFTWNLRILIEPAVAGPAFHVRFLVWRSFTRLPLTAMTDLLEASSITSPVNYQQEPMFTIYYDEVWLLPWSDGTSTTQIFKNLLIDIQTDFVYAVPNLVTNGVLQWGLIQNSGASIDIAVNERIFFET